MPRKTTKKEYTFAVGRRKTSIARVRLSKGRGENMVNGKLLAEYFPGDFYSKLLITPFSTTKTEGMYWFSAKIVGGGKDGQLGALVHGISRALSIVDTNNRSPLKKLGLLTRDARKRQRRHVGTGGKARRQKSSPKR